MDEAQILIETITVDSEFRSVFGHFSVIQENRNGMLLSARIDAQNFRLRERSPGYESDWHVAGDPTLIAVQHGTIRITLRDGSYKDFTAGDTFIAADYLPAGVAFDPLLHGHKAAVVGDLAFQAVHVKLDNNQEG